MTPMPGLAARPATGLPAKTALLVRRWLRIAIGRRRLGGVARVLILPRPQLCDQHLKLGDPLGLLGDQYIARGQPTLQLGMRRAA
jgi:hypothetical protein